MVDLWPGSGVKVHTNKLALVNRKSFAKLVGDLMLMVFTDTELKNGSVSGKKCNFKKSSELFPKEKLDENKTRAIRGRHTFKHFIILNYLTPILTTYQK